MEAILIILMVLFGCAAVTMTYVAFRFNQKIDDLENFMVGFNDDINEFKTSVDRITNANIMVYDELVFDVMSQCKIIRNKLNQYLSKYDEYKNYIYTEEVKQEEQEQDVLGIVRPGISKGPQ